LWIPAVLFWRVNGLWRLNTLYQISCQHFIQLRLSSKFETVAETTKSRLSIWFNYHCFSFPSKKKNKQTKKQCLKWEWSGWCLPMEGSPHLWNRLKRLMFNPVKDKRQINFRWWFRRSSPFKKRSIGPWEPTEEKAVHFWIRRKSLKGTATEWNIVKRTIRKRYYHWKTEERNYLLQKYSSQC